MNKESERVKYLLQNWSHLQLAREYEKLENIIKEVREYIEENCYKKMGGYGDNEDDDIEVCLFEDDIWELKEILDKGE